MSIHLKNAGRWLLVLIAFFILREAAKGAPIWVQLLEFFIMVGFLIYGFRHWSKA